MSRLVELNLNPDRRTLRQFGFIALGGFGLIGLLAFREWMVFSAGLGPARLPVAFACWGLGLLSALLSLVAPSANRPIYVGLALVSYPIGFVLSYVIMAVLFFGIFTPVALVFKVIGRDSLQRRRDRTAASYWQPPRPARSTDSYFRQF